MTPEQFALRLVTLSLPGPFSLFNDMGFIHEGGKMLWNLLFFCLSAAAESAPVYHHTSLDYTPGGGYGALFRTVDSHKRQLAVRESNEFRSWTVFRTFAGQEVRRFENDLSRLVGQVFAGKGERYYWLTQDDPQVIGGYDLKLNKMLEPMVVNNRLWRATAMQTTSDGEILVVWHLSGISLYSVATGRELGWAYLPLDHKAADTIVHREGPYLYLLFEKTGGYQEYKIGRIDLEGGANYIATAVDFKGKLSRLLAFRPDPLDKYSVYLLVYSFYDKNLELIKKRPSLEEKLATVESPCSFAENWVLLDTGRAAGFCSNTGLDFFVADFDHKVTILQKHWPKMMGFLGEISSDGRMAWVNDYDTNRVDLFELEKQGRPGRHFSQ